MHENICFTIANNANCLRDKTSNGQAKQSAHAQKPKWFGMEEEVSGLIKIE